MKVLILSNMYPSRAKPYAGVFVKNQVDLLRQNHSDSLTVTCLAMRRKFTGPLGSIAKYTMFAVRCFPHLFKSYDVVHIHYFIPIGAFGWLYRKLHKQSKLVVTFHGGDVNSKHYLGWRGRFWRNVSRAVDRGIAVGPKILEQVEQHLDVGSVVVQSAGIDSRRFYRPTTTTPVKEFDFVFAGSFSHRKGVDLLIEALTDKHLRSARVAFVGTGPYRSEIVNLGEAIDLQIFDYLSQDEMRDVFWRSKFLVLPSRSEPFGLVVSEAMFCGVPVIVSDEPGLLMQVKDGRNGLVCRSGSLQSLQEKMVSALGLPESGYADMVASVGGGNPDFDIFIVLENLVQEYGAMSRKVSVEGAAL